MTKEEIRKHLTSILEAWESADDKGKRDFCTALLDILRHSDLRSRFLKLNPNFRKAVHTALYPYDEDPNVFVTCPHCGNDSILEATTCEMSKADGYWSIVREDDSLYMDWHDDYEVEVTELQFLCSECGESLAGSLDELEELWREQQKKSTNEELGILGQ